MSQCFVEDGLMRVCWGSAASAHMRALRYVRALRCGTLVFAVFWASGSAVFADDAPAPSVQFYFSMRAPSVDPAPRYVVASPAPADGKTSDVEGCDGQTYYLALSDAAAVRAAIANANTVQLEAVDPGADPSAGRVLCLMQASN